MGKGGEGRYGEEKEGWEVGGRGGGMGGRGKGEGRKNGGQRGNLLHGFRGDRRPWTRLR